MVKLCWFWHWYTGINSTSLILPNVVSFIKMRVKYDLYSHSKLWLACVISHLCHEHNSSGFWVFVSLTTFSHKLCICSMINSCRLFLHKVNTQHYCVQRRRTHSNHVFQWKSLLRVLCPKGIDRDAMWFQTLGTILDWLAGWLAGYVAQIAFISCANVFLAAFSWRHPFLSCAISTIKNFTRDRMQRSQNKVVHFSWDYNQPILFASQWQFPKDPRNHAHDWKQRRLHLVLIFECTFQWLITCASGYFFSQLFFLIKHF